MDCRHAMKNVIHRLLTTLIKISVYAILYWNYRWPT